MSDAQSEGVAAHGADQDELAADAFKTVEQEMQDVGLSADDLNAKFTQARDAALEEALTPEQKFRRYLAADADRRRRSALGRPR